MILHVTAPLCPECHLLLWRHQHAQSCRVWVFASKNFVSSQTHKTLKRCIHKTLKFKSWESSPIKFVSKICFVDAVIPENIQFLSSYSAVRILKRKRQTNYLLYIYIYIYTHTHTRRCAVQSDSLSRGRAWSTLASVLWGIFRICGHNVSSKNAQWHGAYDWQSFYVSDWMKGNERCLWISREGNVTCIHRFGRKWRRER